MLVFLFISAATLGVSVYYFSMSKNGTLGERVAVSAHGAAISLLALGAYSISASGTARESFLLPYWWLFSVPVVLVALALWRFRGPAWVHFMQFANLICGVLTAFVGSMAVTGNWL